MLESWSQIPLFWKRSLIPLRWFLRDTGCSFRGSVVSRSLITFFDLCYYFSIFEVVPPIGSFAAATKLNDGNGMNEWSFLDDLNNSSCCEGAEMDFDAMFGTVEEALPQELVDFDLDVFLFGDAQQQLQQPVEPVLDFSEFLKL
ncbi:UNVERIFIED_CONTAM: hypothetical protein HDU68_006720 [Siphonaria sp. JEL0065]|nr:hypothetical protein HDU68_006720 [Siphonaria sp. JEL0065]